MLQEIGSLTWNKQTLRNTQVQKLTQEETEILNRYTTSKKFESVMNALLRKRSRGTDGFAGELHQTFKDELTPILLKLVQRTEGWGVGDSSNLIL